jgi:hypothetical protein
MDLEKRQNGLEDRQNDFENRQDALTAAPVDLEKSQDDLPAIPFYQRFLSHCSTEVDVAAATVSLPLTLYCVNAGLLGSIAFSATSFVSP